MSESFWSGIQLFMESAATAAVAIDGINRQAVGQDPGHIEYTGSDPSDGDIVRVNAPGMLNVDGRIFKVANVDGAGDDFDLEGFDLSAENAFTSGDFQVVTIDTPITNIIDIANSGGEAQRTTFQYLTEKFERSSVTGRSAIERTLTLSWDPADSNFNLLRSFEGLTKAFRLVFENGNEYFFNGDISFNEEPIGAANEVVTTSIAITANGRGTAYAA